MMSDYRVMLIDDEEEYAGTLAERLELRGISTRVVLDGQEGLTAIDEDPPDIVLLDVMMPGFSGLETLRQIKKAHPRVEVILLTGRGSTREGIEGMRLGAFDYLMKPVQIEELIERFQAALAPRPIKG
ncbi:MAG: response regulator [Desulfobacterales bacterium]|nr:response regulator [Desulfobacterales bacterium]